MKKDLLAKTKEAGVIATLRAEDDTIAFEIVKALVKGGITALEITYTTPNAGLAIAKVREQFGSELLIGAGTLTSEWQVLDAHSAGAEFFVSPGFDLEVAEAVEKTGGLSIMGAFTATEVQRVAKHHVDAIKFFPGVIGGPAALRALRGPFPELKFIPTGGVSHSNLKDWFDSGAIAVGAGGELIPSAAIRDEDFESITQKARLFLSAMQEWRTNKA